jgi:flagellar basal-body rod protein FlgB
MGHRQNAACGQDVINPTHPFADTARWGKMDLKSIGLFAGLTKRMAWLNQRTRVLAQNIANTDTPGYEAKDLKPLSFREMVGSAKPGLSMNVTQKAHMTANGGNAAARAGKEAKNRDPYEAAPTGNSVVLEEQMMKLAETQMDYRLTTNLYRKNVELLKTAIGNR